MCKDPPEQLRVARRTLEEFSFCRIVDDLAAYADYWTLHISITIDNHRVIPRDTEWYVVLPRNYPYGEIAIFPSKTNGITETYPHQAFNCCRCDDLPWLTGNPCVSSSLRTLGRRTYDVEPMSVEMRLAWHIRRLWLWLKDADDGALIKTGDPFELPEYPNTLATENFGFFGSIGKMGELDEESWGKYGSVIMHKIVGECKTHVWVPIRFKDVHGNVLSDQSLNDLPECDDDDILAIWVQVKNIPHIVPWRGIRTYGELFDFFKHEGINLNEIIMKFSRDLRDGKRHLLLIGFPVPDTAGSVYGSWYWLAALLPTLANGRVDGFRKNAQSYLLHDRAVTLTEQTEIQWVKSRSWRSADILSRGSFDKNLTTSNVLVIGLGAIGAFVAELLVRAGVKHLTLVDGDRLEIGNLTRHTLSVKDIGAYKVEAISRRLRMAEPHVIVNALPYSFYEANRESRYEIISSDLIIDCTGDDSLLYDLSRTQFGSAKMFVSVSVGFGARQVFVFCTKATSFPADKFKEMLNPYLMKERDMMVGKELPRDGIGCWHPAFPARCDDVWLMTSAAVKIVEEFVQGHEQRSGLTVLRQKIIGGVFCGIEKVPAP